MSNQKIITQLHFMVFLAIFASGDIVGKDTIYVVQRDWHTGIVLDTESIEAPHWPEIEEYAHYRYIDVSWGDERYYQASNPGVLLAARAVLFPTSGVIRVTGINAAIDDFYDHYTVLQIIMDDKQMQRLSEFIASSFKRNEQGERIPSSVRTESKLYFMSVQKYHLFRTCNTWVAMVLEEAGLDISPFLVISKVQLLNRAGELEPSSELQ